jgi:hypothetical protein
MGTGDLSLGVKWLNREADHSPSASAEVKKMWIYINSPIQLHGIVINSLSTGTTLPLPKHTTQQEETPSMTRHECVMGPYIEHQKRKNKHSSLHKQF